MTFPPPQIETHPDIALIEQIIQRDQDALMALYERYGGAVYSVAYRVLQAQYLAEEVTQDIFLKIWHQPERWDVNRGRLSTWLLTITRNAAIDRLRKEKRQPLQKYELQDNIVKNSISTAVDEPLWHDGQLIHQLLLELPPKQQLLIEYAFFQGYTHSELAELLDMPLGTVKTRLRSGLQKLRKLWHQAQ